MTYYPDLSVIELFAPSVAPECENPWKLVAERGLFAYDGNFPDGPYRLVAAPVLHAHFADSPRLSAAALQAR